MYSHVWKRYSHEGTSTVYPHVMKRYSHEGCTGYSYVWKRYSHMKGVPGSHRYHMKGESVHMKGVAG